jgi:diguanylate cyclase (GGDEF)-like protein
MEGWKPTQQSTILLITDDATTRAAVAEGVLGARFRLVEARDAREGWQALWRGSIDLVLLDVTDPGPKALEFCEPSSGEERPPLPPVVLLAGEEAVEVVHRGHELGVQDVITKPFSRRLLAQRLRYLLSTCFEHRDLVSTLARMKQAQEFARVGNWEWTLTSGRLEFSDEAREILGIAPTAALQTVDRVLRNVPAEDRPRVGSWLQDASQGGIENTIEHRISKPGGGEQIVRQRSIVTQNALGLPERVAVIVTDVTEWRQAEVENEYQAFHDLVTGLDNHERFLQRLEEASWVVQRSGGRFAVLYLGVAKFSRIHESLGHRFGDGVLESVAERLRGALRKTDGVCTIDGEARTPRLARINGANFGILLQPVGQVEDVARLAKRINESFAAPIVREGKEFFLSTNIGVSIFPDDCADSEGLIRLAQTAMTRSQEEGRTDIQFVTAQMNDEATERLTLEASLRHALELDQFEAHYQPKVDVASGRIAGMEALIRWRDPERGLVPPGKFISVAEESGIIVPMGEWILREACAQAKAWQAAGHAPIPVAVNVSMEQFRRADIVGVVARALEDTGLEARWLELELTESAVMDNTEDNIVILRQLKDLGVLLSVDDFGTGYSSLSYLRQFPIDVLKIDRSFVIDLPDDSDAATIVTTIVHMARNLGLKLIAEGVETEEQLGFLRMLGCDQYQGFLFSKPVPAEEVAQLLEQSRARASVQRGHSSPWGGQGRRNAG